MKNTIYIAAFALILSFFGAIHLAEAAFAPAQISVLYPNNGEILEIGTDDVITWKASNYPLNQGVNINLLKLVSESPKQYTLVRTIAENTANDGQENWTPRSDEQGTNFYIEVTCSLGGGFQNGCTSGTTAKSFAMIDIPNRNLANPLSAFEKLLYFLKMELAK